MRIISLIAPCYNEDSVIEQYYLRICSVADRHKEYEFEFVVVDDASVDQSLAILDRLAQKDPRLKVIHLAANVGHQTALFAGIENATGDINVTLDIDLQDPPELLSEFLAKIDLGFDVVHAQRKSRSGESPFKLISAKLFYQVIKHTSRVKIIKDCGDFRAFTKPVRQTIIRFRERHKFLRGLFVLVGFKQTIIQYERCARYGGETKYTLIKMTNLAVDAMLNFSQFPIRLMFIVSSLMWSLGFIYLVKAMFSRFVFGTAIEGWTSIIFFQVLFTGVLLFFIALLGAYIGRIYEQGQSRPLYWIRYTKNIDQDHDG